MIQHYGKSIGAQVIEIGIAEFASKNSNSVFATYGPHKPTGRLQQLIAKSKAEKNVLIHEDREGYTPYILLNGRLLAFYSNKLKEIDGEQVPTELLTDIWTDISWDSLSVEGQVEFKNGKKPEKLLKRLYEMTDIKFDDYVLDFFVGSGTTFASSLKINAKAIGIELGEYFETRTLRRVKYTLNGEGGGISKIVGWKGGGLVKYQVLESYEDVLNNLQLQTKATILQFDKAAQEEYLLKYMLDLESRDHLFDVNIFSDPFNYRLNITQNNELQPVKIDLVETFNYLIGLYVVRIQRVKDIKLVEGHTREGKKTLVIWRNLDTTSNVETQTVFRKLYDSVRSAEFDQIFINGDHHFDNLRQGQDQFKVKLIEETFFKKMFNN